MSILVYRLLALILFASVGKGKKLSSVGLAFEKGSAAYTGERWSECIAQFEDAIHLYKLYKSVIANCRLKCNNKKFQPLYDNIEDLQIYDKFFQKRICLKTCHEILFDELHLDSQLDDKTLSNMKSRKPYEYLHICYFEMNALPKAASAAYTYLVAHPEDSNMKQNAEYYIAQQEVNKQEVVDLESEEYEVLFNIAISSYGKSNWGETVSTMEEVIYNYLTWENKCRVECEDQPQQDSSPEFVMTVSNNIASLVHCRQQCQDALKKINYNSGLEFLAEILNYLQISYYRLDKMHKAATNVATYLSIYPKDIDMLANKDIYSTLVGDDAFVERSDIVFYSKRDLYEKELLKLFHN